MERRGGSCTAAGPDTEGASSRPCWLLPGSCTRATPTPATCAVHNRIVEAFRFARSARKHRIGRAHVMHVIETVSPSDVAAAGEFDARKIWLGPDDRGVELEIVAVVLPGELLIIHVMPTALGRKP